MDLLRGRRHELAVLTDARESTAFPEALDAATDLQREKQVGLLTGTEGIGTWDLEVATQLVFSQHIPLEAVHELQKKEDIGFQARLAAQRHLERHGDFDEAGAIENLSKLQAYQQGAGMWQAWITAAELTIYRNLAFRIPTVTNYILRQTQTELTAIETGQAPTYENTIKLAIALGYYKSFRGELTESNAAVNQLVNTAPIFNKCAPVDTGRMPGLYAHALLGNVLDSNDTDNPCSEAFTLGMFGSDVHRYNGPFRNVLSAFGFSAAVAFLNQVDRDIQTGGAFEQLIPAADATSPARTPKGIFGFRLRSAKNSLQNAFGQMDDNFSAGQTGSTGAMLLTPEVVAHVLSTPDAQRKATQFIAAQNRSIAPALSANGLRQQGLGGRISRRRGKLVAEYKDLGELQKAIILASLTPKIYEAAAVDYADVLSGRLPQPDGMLNVVVNAFRHATNTLTP
ncbi:MAG: hypothetical protein ACE5DX_02145 [Candidatus Dojkabacteria bacterium]